MKSLNGKELADYIKQRQAKAVRALRQTHGVQPKLAIVLASSHPASAVYTRMKKAYGADILVDVDIHQVKQSEARALIRKLNKDAGIHGVIVQLPLEKPEETDDIVNLVAPEKDVDALGGHAKFEPATPLAILWLLAGYNVDLKGKKVLLIGRGKLVGRPLLRMLKESGVDAQAVGRDVKDLKDATLQADVIITATGNPGIIRPDMLKPGAVVVDAGVAGEKGKTVGDLAPEVYEREDLTITPQKGGVGPLTVCALFENVIQAARNTTENTHEAA